MTSSVAGYVPTIHRLSHPWLLHLQGIAAQGASTVACWFRVDALVYHSTLDSRAFEDLIEKNRDRREKMQWMKTVDVLASFCVLTFLKV